MIGALFNGQPDALTHIQISISINAGVNAKRREVGGIVLGTWSMIKCGEHHFSGNELNV
jgi:hypothetical protein